MDSGLRNQLFLTLSFSDFSTFLTFFDALDLNPKHFISPISLSDPVVETIEKNVSKSGEKFPAGYEIKNRQRYMISDLRRLHEFVVKSIFILKFENLQTLEEIYMPSMSAKNISAFWSNWSSN